jgi:hypothetical protein
VAFSDLVAAMDQTVLNTFADTPTYVVYPQNGQPQYPIQAIVKNPALEEDYVPGSDQGVSVLLLFVRFVGLPTLPHQGDRVEVQPNDGGASVFYDLLQPKVDREGGATLVCRRRS